MVCVNCGKDIKGTVITQEDGTVYCYTCKKAEMRKPGTPTVTKTKDPFVKMARKLLKIKGIVGSGAPFFDRVFMCQGSKRVYTNGQVLISEIENTPKKYKLVSIDSLWELSKEERFKYPNIEKVLKLRSAFGNSAMVIPEDFYQYAEAFSKSWRVRVKLRQEGIIVDDSRDDSKMVYGEFKVPASGEADFDFRYFMVLKPREILVDSEKGPARIESSYVEGLENCVHMLLMPLTRRD